MLGPRPDALPGLYDQTLDIARVRGTTVLAITTKDVVRVTSSRDEGRTWTPFYVAFDGVESGSVEASTVNGDVVYLGELRDDGRYNFSTHDGDLVLGMPEHANATVQVSTFSGDFESAFPVQLDRTRRGKRFNFTMGTGSALVNLESFDGTIHLRRVGELREILKLKQLKVVKDLKDLKDLKLRERMKERMVRDAEKDVEKDRQQR